MAKNMERLNLLSESSSKSGTSGRPQAGRPNDSRADRWASYGSRAKSVEFGTPSNDRVKTASHTAWGSLINRSLHGGIAGLFGGGGVLSAIGGLRNVISSALHLFGSQKKTPPPLSLFKLPDSQAETIYTNTRSASPQSQNTIYSPATAQPTAVYHNAEIAQAVKQALLTSNSLSDVISEL